MFLRNSERFELFNEPGIVVHACQFDKDAYQDNMFASEGIAFSDSLQRAVPKRKAEFLAGRHCAKKALAAFGVENYTVVADKNRCPLWPNDLKGAISHSNQNAMVALTDRADLLGVGIDVEAVMSTKTMNDITKMIMPGDDRVLLQMPEHTPETILSLCFSIKESFFKAAYPSTGYYFDFDAVVINQLDFSNNRFVLTVKQDLNPQVRPGRVCEGEFVFHDGQVVSLLPLTL